MENIGWDKEVPLENREQIGKVWLDLNKYPGEDFYCDGAVEDEILEIVRDYSAVEYQKMTEEKKSWPIFYHLSSQRENIVEFLPIGKEDKVLEVGSGCGAITGAFARKASSVTCVDLSKKRSTINAYRHSESENVTIHVGNFKDIEPQLPTDYDYICLIGVFEYGQSYIGGENPFAEFLQILKKHLKETGRIVIAIENKYGLKYFAGCMEDHLGTYFSGIENYTAGGGVRTFSRNGLEKIFRECGIKQYHFYYPYPDYKFMTTLYSDKKQPRQGELSNNLRNFDRDRMLLFDEKNAFDGLCKDELFPVFSNSYLVVLGEELEVNYAKYSNDRAPQYQIKTVIAEWGDGQKEVRKYPLNESAREHIANMVTAYEGLKARYEGSDLQVNKCKLIDKDGEYYIRFEFAEGKPLAEYMDECLDKQDDEGFMKLFEEYLEHIGYKEEYPVADYDLVFSNILIDGDKWTLIDYEWTFGKAVETKEVAFRAIYCYLLENEKRNCIPLERILDRLGITQKDAEDYRKQERDFQKFVTGKYLSMGEMRELIGGRIYEPQKWMHRVQGQGNIFRVQIYKDMGNGYREEESEFIEDAFQGENLIEFEYVFDGNVQNLRIDPAFASCICKVREMTLNGEAVSLTTHGILYVNGKVMKGKEGISVVFPTADPNMNISIHKLQPKAENRLYLKMEIVQLPIEMAEDIQRSIKKLF